MIRLERKNYSTILIGKQLKYQLNHQVNFINMNILLEKIYYHLINNKIIEQARFTYSPLGKVLEKQTKTIKDQGEKQMQDKGQVKTIKNMIMMLKILQLSQNKKKYLMSL